MASHKRKFCAFYVNSTVLEDNKANFNAEHLFWVNLEMLTFADSAMKRVDSNYSN
jgi:hypothetical protein